jgi:hypothetical protein
MADGPRFADVDCSIDTPFKELRNNACIGEFVWRTDKELGGELGRKFWFAIELHKQKRRTKWLAVVLGGGFLLQTVTRAAQGIT